MNGSVKWLGVPASFCDTGVAWTENILILSPRWVDVVTYTTWSLGTEPGVLIGAAVLWCSVVPACPDCLPINPL